ncbi:TPR domain-containing protein, partial [Salmonella enterica]|uniref:TPR domain-containing protein n=1 Tax=Salmonella enterica TaxID=28901 RepID=UPI004046CE47
DPEDNRRGGELLRRLVSRDHTDIRVLSLYAFSAFEQQRFGEAGGGWGVVAEVLAGGGGRGGGVVGGVGRPTEFVFI